MADHILLFVKAVAIEPFDHYTVVTTINCRFVSGYDFMNRAVDFGGDCERI